MERWNLPVAGTPVSGKKGQPLDRVHRAPRPARGASAPSAVSTGVRPAVILVKLSRRKCGHLARAGANTPILSLHAIAEALPRPMKPPASDSGLDSPDDLPPYLARLEPRFHSMLRHFRIPPADGEDLLQTIALLALLHWEQIRQPAPWLLGTLRKRCLLYHRNRRLAARRQLRIEDRRPSGHRDDAGAPSRSPMPPLPALPAPREPLEARIDVDRLLRAMPARHRLVLTARYRLGLADGEVAEATGLAVGSVRKVIQRALADVRSAAAGGSSAPRQSGRR